ncbi:MAG TPA: thioredoxin family protein [Bacillota bacterium]|nr:thioredoxin family protein [Bacillota bacterium]
MMTVKILGTGCKNCRTLLENTRKAVRKMGIDADVEYITDLEKIVSYGVMKMPALIINEKVMAMGKVLKPEEIEKIIRGI